MNSKEALERFRELKNNDLLLCTQEELNDFLLCGIVLNNNNKYTSRFNEELNIKIIKPKNMDFDLNLNNLLNNCSELAKQNNTYRIYCMSQRCYDIYKQLGLIINKSGKDYYRYFQEELWLVNIIN